MKAFVIVVAILSLLFPVYYFQDIDAVYDTKISNPDIQTIDGHEVVQTSVGSQVILSITIVNNDSNNQPFVAIVEVRNSEQVTEYLQFQKGVLTANSETEIGVSWTPEKKGDYQIRSFIISDLENPTVLSPVMQSVLIVGSTQIISDEERIIDDDSAESNDEPYYEEKTNTDLDKLRQYALDRINEDREKFHLSPVQLSDNKAAQVHAEDVFKTKYISHWMTNGEKPYMTYSRLNGIGYVAQNVATSGDKQYHEDCSSGHYLCEKIDPFRKIDAAEYGMMYEDEECCDNGHRDNILDKYHTHVSIGIEYDDYFFVIVQNFEGQYITWSHEINDNDADSGVISMSGYFERNRDSLASNDIILEVIDIEYDPIPTTETYQQNFDKMSYDSGELVASVIEPAPPGSYYEEDPPDYTFIEADKWDINTREFSISFSLEELISKYGDGVYTIDVWGKDYDGKDILTANISIFIT